MPCPGNHEREFNNGETPITMSYYHAPDADQTPTPHYELFETIALKKKRRG